MNGVYSQNLTVRVTDSSGNPLKAVSVFIPEINKGLISDKDGNFQTFLKNGSYTLIFKYPGYKNTLCNIEIQNDNITKELGMEIDKLFTYKEIPDSLTIRASTIIKNSINAAPTLLNAANYYDATSYINGKMVFEEVSDFVSKINHKLDGVHLYELKNQIIPLDIYLNVKYYSPQTYRIKKEGYLGYIPEDVTDSSILNFINGSIYSDKFNGIISPLNKKAFNYYKYTYEGYYDISGVKRHKIKICPKYRDPDLIEGYLYIKDGSWSVDIAVMSINRNGLKSSVIITYHPIVNKIYLPITVSNDITFNSIGLSGIVQFYSIFQYKEILRNSTLSNRPEDILSEDFIHTETNNRDEQYWDSIRIHRIDSIEKKQRNTQISLRNQKIDLSKLLLANLVLGGYLIGSDTSFVWLKYNGLKMIFRDYNYVDGFWLGNKFDIKMNLRKNRNIESHPYIYYATARKRLLGGSDVIYNYNPKRQGQLAFSFGSRSEDFNNLSLTRYQNYFNSLILGENTNFFYQRDFLSVSNNIHLNSKIKASVSIGIEKRSGLKNHTDFSILGRNKIKENIFPNERFDKTFYTIDLYFSPRSNFSITEALDMYSNSITPIFNIEYQESFSSWQINNSKYKMLKGGVSHNIPIDYFNSLDYKVEAGTYLEKGRNMHFVDYRHFGASDMLLNLNSLFDSFLLLDNYQLQTNKYWINVFLNYSGKYMMLKFIPFLQRVPLTENLHFKALFTPESKLYIETGYSVSVNRFFATGAFVSFNNVQGRKFGIRLSFNLKSLNLT